MHILNSDYSRHIAGGGGEFPLGNSKFPPEIWQRGKFVQLILMRIFCHQMSDFRAKMH